MKIPQVSLQVFHIIFGVLVTIAALIYFNRDWESDIYPLDEHLSLERIDYFSHYRLLDDREYVLLDEVEEVGILPVGYIFKSGDNFIAVKNGMEKVQWIEESTYENLKKRAEVYNPWNLTDEINDSNPLRLLFKINAILIIIVLLFIGGKQIRRRMDSLEEDDPTQNQE